MYLLVPATSLEGVLKMELLEDFLVTMSLRSPHLAVKLVCKAEHEADGFRPLPFTGAQGGGKGSVGKQAHLIRLAMEVEDIMLARAAWSQSTCEGKTKPTAQAAGSPAYDPLSSFQDLNLSSGSKLSWGEGREGVLGGNHSGQRRPLPHRCSSMSPSSSSLRVTTSKALSVSPHRTSKVSVPRQAVGRGEGRDWGERWQSPWGDDEEVDGNDDDGEEEDIPLQRSLMRTLVQPTGAQSSLVGDELLLLRGARRAIAGQLGMPYKAKLLIDDYGGGGGGGGGVTEWTKHLPSHNKTNRYFEEQLTFVQSLVDIAERLRFIEPVSSRGKHLERELAGLEGH
ncbi:unnamed protein product, partial [Choristocarpus tenellus]